MSISSPTLFPDRTNTLLHTLVRLSSTRSQPMMADYSIDCLDKLESFRLLREIYRVSEVCIELVIAPAKHDFEDAVRT